MTVISSQKFRSEDIIEEKIEQLKGSDKLVVPVVNAHTQDLDGNELYIMIDNHHSLSAAIELGIAIEFEEVADETAYYKDIEEENGEAICEAHYMDSNWYYIDIEEENGYGEEVW